MGANQYSPPPFACNVHGRHMQVASITGFKRITVFLSRFALPLREPPPPTAPPLSLSRLLLFAVASYRFSDKNNSSVNQQRREAE